MCLARTPARAEMLTAGLNGSSCFLESGEFLLAFSGVYEQWLSPRVGMPACDSGSNTVNPSEQHFPDS